LFSSHSLAAVEALCDRVVVLSHGRTVFEGAVADASAAAQHGAVVVTADEAGLMAAARAVGGVVAPEASGFRIGEAGRWRVALPREVTHPALMGALAAHGVAIFAFEPVKPDLEGAFWALSGKSGPDVRAQDAPALAESRAA
jgi:ABC-2 type transport system ATP-binding protein